MADPKSVNLPEGFVLDEPEIPSNFILDKFRFGGGGRPSFGVGGGFGRFAPLEQRIAQRPDILHSFFREATTLPTQEQFIRHPFKTTFGLGMKPAAMFMKGVGGLAQRGLAVPANIAEELQKGEVGPFTLGRAAWKAVSGERLGELGDIARRAGWPEPLSATLGLLASLGVGNLATKGRIVENIKRAKNIATGKLPRVMGKDYVKVRAEEGVKALKDLRQTLGTEVKNAIQAVDDVGIDAQQLSKDLPRLPQRVLSALDDPIYNIQKLPDGSYKPTVGNLHRIKEALDDFMTTKTWEEAGRKSQKLVKQAYGVIRRAMGKAAPEINEPMKNYGNFMDTYRKVSKTLQESGGTILEKRLRGAFKPGAERAYQEAWEDFAKIYPKAGQIIKDMIKFNRRAIAKRWVKRIALIGGGYELARRGLRPLFEGLEGGGGGYEGGGY